MSGPRLAENKTILADLHETYLERCGHPKRQKAAWQNRIAPAWPPDLANPGVERPSLGLARTAGDLGCALFWIVQAALVRPCLDRVKAQTGLAPDLRHCLEAMIDTDCGALAHSESWDAPVVIARDGDDWRLEGVKKYITGGDQADFILITARFPGEEKVSRLILLPGREIAPFAMQDLDLNGLYTIGHGRLTLSGQMVSASYGLPLPPAEMRRTLKVGSLVERSLILEAVLGAAVYLNQRLARRLKSPPVPAEALSRRLQEQQDQVSAVIADARAGRRVAPALVALAAINDMLDTILKAADNLGPDPEADLTARLQDLRFLRSLWNPS